MPTDKSRMRRRRSIYRINRMLAIIMNAMVSSMNPQLLVLQESTMAARWRMWSGTPTPVIGLIIAIFERRIGRAEG
jgi:hypothetical protein